jgi:hypothetical protein
VGVKQRLGLNLAGSSQSGWQEKKSGSQCVPEIEPTVFIFFSLSGTLSKTAILFNQLNQSCQ